MFLYEKWVNGVRKLFGTNANVPSENDTEIVFKDKNGTVLTDITVTTQLRDGGKGNMVKPDGTEVNAWMGNVSVIPKGLTPAKTLQSIAWTTAPAKVNYNVGDTLTLEGAVVKATYSDSTTADVTSQCTFSPANGEILAAENTKVTATFQTKTADQTITVVAPVAAKTATTEKKEK